jgi:hypothetical protein
VTIPPDAPAKRAPGRPPSSLPDVQAAVAPATPARPRGYRARPAAEVCANAKELAGQVAAAACQALPAEQEHGTLTVVTTPEAGWFRLAATVLETFPQPPVQGVTDVVTAFAAVPPAVAALGPITSGFRRWVQTISFGGHSQLITEAELGGLWLDSVVAALVPPAQRSPRRDIHIAGVGAPAGNRNIDYYLVTSVLSATLIWRPRRWSRKAQDVALAQWLLTSARGHVIGAGIASIAARATLPVPG